MHAVVLDDVHTLMSEVFTNQHLFQDQEAHVMSMTLTQLMCAALKLKEGEHLQGQSLQNYKDIRI